MRAQAPGTAALAEGSAGTPKPDASHARRGARDRRHGARSTLPRHGLSVALALALLIGWAGEGRAAEIGDLVAVCDRLASHPADPDRAAPGLARSKMDLAAAEAACRAAHDAYPEHARTAYHLGRAIYYQGRHREALPFLEAAAAAGYRQGLFVLGYVLTTGEGVPVDFCRAGRLWRQAVALDHPWSAYHLIEKELDGRFPACGRPARRSEMAHWLDLMRERITVAASDGRVEALALRATPHLERLSTPAPK
jgi:hypothetical protein